MEWFNKLKDILGTMEGNRYIDESRDLYGDTSKVNIGGEADAYRHLLWTAEMARKTNPTIAKGISDYHEKVTLPFGLLGSAHPLQTKEEKEMDLYNNQLGIQIGGQSKSYEDTMRLAQEAIARGDVTLLGNKIVPNTYESYAKQRGFF